MINTKKLLIIFTLTFIAANASAYPSEDFINHLSQIIFNDCQGATIFVDLPYHNNLDNKDYNFFDMPWPYTLDEIKYITNELGKVDDKYTEYCGNCESPSFVMGNALDGCNVLTCKENKLTINKQNYFWNLEEVDYPKNSTTGDNSPIIEGSKNVVVGQNNNVANFDWQLSFAGGSIFGAIATLLIQYIRKYVSKNKKKDKETLKVDDKKSD